MAVNDNPGQASLSRVEPFNPAFLAANVRLQRPLSRRGKGPGLVIFIPGQDERASLSKETLDPVPLQKWAEEGFAVVEITVSYRTTHPARDVLNMQDACERGTEALQALPECTFDGKLCAIVYDLEVDLSTTAIWDFWRTVWKIPGLSAVVFFGNRVTPASHSDQLTHEAPLMIHSVRSMLSGMNRTNDITHVYESASSPNFVLPYHEHYQPGPAGVAHSRSLGFIKKHLGGPYFDLEVIWDEHTLYEFGERNVEKTMATMVAEPYVNHVPTLTGGVGRASLTAFYRDHFIFSNPPDTNLELISRTVGIDRIIDEFIFSFTHTKVIDWLIPGIPPTQKHVRVPFTSIVNVRGDRLYHEHIAWDQASVLRQLGLLPEYLPFPYPLPNGRLPAKGKRFEYRVPAVGADTSSKMTDEGSVASNGLLNDMKDDGWAIREVDDVD